MFMYHHQIARQHYNITRGGKSFETVVALKYFGNENNRSVKGILNSGNTTYHSFQNLLFLVSYLKT